FASEGAALAEARWLVEYFASHPSDPGTVAETDYFAWRAEQESAAGQTIESCSIPVDLDEVVELCRELHRKLQEQRGIDPAVRDACVHVARAHQALLLVGRDSQR